MCDVHLLETARQTVLSLSAKCCYCGQQIEGPGVLIKGVLDDGTPGELQFVYHEDCAFDMEFDFEEIEGNDGCFSYGAPATELNLEGSVHES